MKQRSLILFFISIVPMLLYSTDRIAGVWNWDNTKTILGQKMESYPDAKVLFNADGTAVYKQSGVEPVKASWVLEGDTLIVSSNNFIWDIKYLKAGDGFMFSYDINYPPEKNGKLLNCPGEKEIYILHSDSALLVPIDSKETGCLRKSNLTKDDFNKYTPHHALQLVNSFDIHKYTEIEGKPQRRHTPRVIDPAFIDRINPFPIEGKIDSLLEQLPEKIDSIEIKVLELDRYIYDYFAIDRRAFDKTFDYLLEHNDSNGYNIDYVLIKDSTLISRFCDYLKYNRPFPAEAISITPNNAYRQSRGDTGNFGIYTERSQNNDPLEVRGKIIIYSNNEVINCYMSHDSFDFKSHRYNQSSLLEFFFIVLTLDE